MIAGYYRMRAEARARGERLDPEEAKREQRPAVKRLRDRWKSDLEDSSYEARSIGALPPSFNQWLDREHGVPSYRLTQETTGHGCFGHYLHEIKPVDWGPTRNGSARVGREPSVLVLFLSDAGVQHRLVGLPRGVADRMPQAIP
ncbi:uncharacterized protein LOC133522963 [Cydia pomonella]|uniref:uncharacterized protein LOC133522963 n=1 Tax=Cydia pomonella TaxID=82600 RepID=UPI002ADE1EE6|nr:uncharacterized protein LOC133522963 [Cydia pomonella]